MLLRHPLRRLKIFLTATSDLDLWKPRKFFESVSFDTCLALKVPLILVNGLIKELLRLG